MQKKRRTPFMLVALLLCSILVFVACEPVGGLDIDKALQASTEVQSSEGKASFSVEVLMDEGALGMMMNNPALLPLAEGLQVDMYEMKQQDMNTVSLAGNLLFAGQTIPFGLSITKEDMVLEVEGIGKPIVMSNSLSAEELEMLGMGADIQDQLLNVNTEMARAMVSYLVPNLPNPDTIDVEKTTVTINEEELDVHKLHAEIYGDEVLGLMETLLQNLVKDEEGLRALIDGLYDLTVPIIDKALEQAAAEVEADAPGRIAMDWVNAYLHNKTLVTEFLFTTVTQGYKTALEELDTVTSELTSAMAASGVDLFTDSSYLKTDYYVNKDLQIVKSDVEVLIAPELPEEAGGFQGVRITATQELWNLNEPVKADLIPSANGVDMTDPAASEQLLKSVDPESFIGQMLIATGMNQKQVFIAIDSMSMDDYGNAYVVNGTTMASVYNLSYDLGLELEWNEEEGYVILADPSTGKHMTFFIEDNKVLVNDESIQLSQGIQTDGYMLYLPVRVVAETFGYEVQWDEDFQMVVLVKSYF